MKHTRRIYFVKKCLHFFLKIKAFFVSVSETIARYTLACGANQMKFFWLEAKKNFKALGMRAMLEIHFFCGNPEREARAFRVSTKKISSTLADARRRGRR